MDISMCQRECPLQKTCKRHQASGTKPDPTYQSWFQPEEIGDKCGSYWKVKSWRITTDGCN